MDLSETAHQARDGDIQAEARLFQTLHVRFVILAKMYLGYEDAQDAAQQACLTVAQKYRELPSEDGFNAWAYQILRNKIGNMLQHRKVESRVLARNENVEARSASGAVDDDLFRQTLLKALRDIGRHDKRYLRILNLVHLGYSADEIAQRIGVNRNHLYVLLHRGRTLLAEQLENRHD
jgi:RNA polymerase sigma-70 factor (ECF subfamily)